MLSGREPHGRPRAFLNPDRVELNVSMASWCEAPACGARPVAGLRQIAARPGKEYFACASAHQRRCPWTKGPDLQADCAFRTAQLPGVSVRIDAEDVSSRPARVGRCTLAPLFGVGQQVA